MKQYLDYEFSSGGITGQDYLTFQTKYINHIKKVCKAIGLTVDRVLKGHYEFSLFITDNENNYVYLSISDVRHFANQWYNNILVRTAKHNKDYTGGRNQYTGLERLQEKLQEMFEEV